MEQNLTIQGLSICVIFHQDLRKILDEVAVIYIILINYPPN